MNRAEMESPGETGGNTSARVKRHGLSGIVVGNKDAKTEFDLGGGGLKEERESRVLV